MRKIILCANEHSQKKETREYTIEGKPYQLNLLEEFMTTVEYCGRIGASRVLELFIDGDGSASLKFKRNDGEDLCEHPDKKNVLDADTVKLRGID